MVGHWIIHMIDTSATESGTSGGMDAGVSASLLAECVWADASLSAQGIAVEDVPFVTIGGGLGSLAMVQMLRLAGVPPADIRVLGGIDLPHQTFRRLAEVSQIGPDDRLRSASDARIDGIWGWPGYALREAV